MDKPRSPPHSTKDMSDNFRGRKDTFMENADELNSEFGSEVYVLLQRSERLHITHLEMNLLGLV